MAEILPADITYGDVASHFMRYFPAHVRDGTQSTGEQLMLGAVTSDQHDRERFGGFFVDYAAAKASEAAPDAAGIVAEECRIVHIELGRILAERRADLSAYKAQLGQRIGHALSRRNESFFIDAAARTADVLEQYEAGAVARDVVAASGAAVLEFRLPVRHREFPPVDPSADPSITPRDAEPIRYQDIA